MPKATFQRPRKIEWEILTPRYGRLVAEPFEKGYALTVGNSLRRTLLAAIPGAAVAWVRIEGGVKAGTEELLLNLKKVAVRLHQDKPVTVRLETRGPKALDAGALAGDPDVEILNPEAPLLQLEKGEKLALEVGIRPGRGYVSAEQHEGIPAGAQPLDAAFSPVQRVNYTVEMSRLGKIIDYEKLTVEVWTNSGITPDEALNRASKLLREHIDLFVPEGAEEEDDVAEASEEARLGGADE